MVQTNVRTRKLVKRKRVKKSDITREMLEKCLMDLLYLRDQEVATIKLHMSRTGAELFNRVMQQEVEKRMESSFGRIMYGDPHVANGRSIQHMLIPE